MKTEIELSVADLKSVLPGLSKVSPRSSTLPVLGYIKVSLDPEQKTICLQAHNLDEVATARLENKASGAPGEVLIPLELLAKLLKGCGADQMVRFMATEQETKIRYSVAGNWVDRVVSHIPAAEWPPVVTCTQEPLPVDEHFKTALKEALECSSQDSSRQVITGACLDVTDKEAHYVVGTDGRHLYSANSFHFGFPEPLIVPARKFVSWAGFVNDGPWKVRVQARARNKDQEEPAWFQIESAHWSYLAKPIEGPFPNWKQVVPTNDNSWTSVVLEPASVETILDAVPLLPGAEDTNKPITLAVGNGILLKAKGKDQLDWTNINVPDARITGKSVQICLNRSYLLKALRFGLNRIAIQDPLMPLVFSAQGKTMVVMPLRADGPEAAPVTPEAESASTETASVAPPSAPEAPTVTEERNNMVATTTTPTTMTAPERGNLRAHGTNQSTNTQPESEETRSAFRAALEQMDRIKTSLRDVMGELSEAVTLLKAAEREQRVSAREIQAIRAKLKEIQSVEI